MILLEQKGLVLSTKGNRAEVSVVRVSACGDSCASCGGECSASSVIVWAETLEKVEAGDVVMIESSTKSILASTVAAYGVPLAFLVAGSIGGIQLFKYLGFSAYELMGFFSGLVLLAASFFVVRKLGDLLNKDKEVFKVTRILKKK